MISEPRETTKPSSLSAEPAAVPKQGEFEHYLAEAHRLRSELIKRGMSRFRRWIMSPFRAAPTPEQTEPFANSLAAIRSAVEILRDTPDLDHRDRRRFAEIILREENRLEALLNVWRGRRGQSV